MKSSYTQNNNIMVEYESRGEKGGVLICYLFFV